MTKNHLAKYDKKPKAVKDLGKWKKVIIPVQHMFPNCNVKYKTKCTDMKTCDVPVPEHLNIPKDFFEKIDVKVTKPPEGFEGW